MYFTLKDHLMSNLIPISKLLKPPPVCTIHCVASKSIASNYYVKMNSSRIITFHFHICLSITLSIQDLLSFFFSFFRNLDNMKDFVTAHIVSKEFPSSSNNVRAFAFRKKNIKYLKTHIPLDQRNELKNVENQNQQSSKTELFYAA